VGGADVVLTSREVGELATYTLATDTQGTALFENLIPGRYDVQAQVRDGPLAKAQAYAPAAYACSSRGACWGHAVRLPRA